MKLLVGVHVQGIDGQIISSELERVEDFGEGELLAIAVDDDFLKVSRGRALTLTSGAFLNFDLMKRSKCFWFILAEW